ncbi:MAG: sulfite exporter TauE/SafE family protein [Chloroflexi bacterium]|nr:sulfite exporter TauE/SafE family protein [Chloroflexota bacterium]
MSDLVPEVGWLVAFGAGVLSFLSPCVAPLVPGYLSYISGVSVHDLAERPRDQTWHIVLSCLLFVLGFSLVFVLLGASASLLGGFIEEYRRPLNRVAGGVMILMGLFIVGLIRLPQLYQERRFHFTRNSFGRGGTVLLGMAFGFGWTPCVGPILASILFYAGAAETAARGALLLLAYSLGLGVPFVLVGLGFSRAMGALGWMRRHYRLINITSGGLLVAVGVLFLTDRFFYFSILAQRLYYTLFY